MQHNCSTNLDPLICLRAKNPKSVPQVKPEKKALPSLSLPPSLSKRNNSLLKYNNKNIYIHLYTYISFITEMFILLALTYSTGLLQGLWDLVMKSNILMLLT